MQINRSLEDKAMDRIDHALGRPLDPMAETYRNFYSTSGDEAVEMAASHCWQEVGGGRDVRCFAVTKEGRRTLVMHLREIDDPHRAFRITFEGHERVVIAAGRSKARYSHFLDIRDAMPDLKFNDYCSRVSVRADR